jgi:hypothetical protein
MTCECYQIGGRFIAEDPDCPAHGEVAQREDRERMLREMDIEDRLKDLLSRVEELEYRLSRVDS